MWPATCMQVNQGDFWLLMVKSQIGSLIFDPSFGHNLCIKYTNGSCEPISNIYVPRVFQPYKKLFNPLSFDPYNHPLKIQEFIETPTPKVGAHLEMCRFMPSHSLTLLRRWNVTLELHSWLTLSQALILVASPRLRLRQSRWPKLNQINHIQWPLWFTINQIGHSNLTFNQINHINLALPF